jgi:Tol biopolymer transport system component
VTGVMRAVVAAAFTSLIVSGTGAAAAPVTERVSVSSFGVPAQTVESRAAVSADGRYVAFESWASNLGRDTNRKPDIFVRDRVLGTTERVSISSSGRQAQGKSTDPAISADGRYVAFTSTAQDLVAGDVNHVRDVFVHDRRTGTTRLVSVSSAGRQANDDSVHPVISADGRIVAFQSSATNLVPADTNRIRDIFVRNLATGRTKRVSVSSTGRQANDRSSSPAVSADGRIVAFGSGASNLVAGDTNEAGDVFVRDRVASKTWRVSVSAEGRQANDVSSRPSVSASGTVVAFESDATNLVAHDTNYAYDVFVRDRVTGTTEKVSLSSTGEHGNSDSYATRAQALSADGRYVAFESWATNLVAGDTNGVGDVFWHDRSTGTTLRVDVSSSGEQTAGEVNSLLSAMSSDGRFVAFWSAAPNLVPGDTSGSDDLFLRGAL